MHPKTKAKYGEISKYVLKLVAGGLLLAATGGLVSGRMQNGEKTPSVAEYSEEQIRRCLVKLRMRGYVKYDKNDFKNPFRLSKKGLVRVNSLSFMDRFINQKTKRWDYLWRVVAFDIPEKKQQKRNALRRKLRSFGFFPYQKSIYVTPFNCEEEITEMARGLHISQYVLVSVTPNLGEREVWVRDWFSKEIGGVRK